MGGEAGGSRLAGWRRRLGLTFVVLGAVSGSLAACSAPSPPAGDRSTQRVDLIRRGPSPAAKAAGITKIKHVVIITQENHSFDNYFGTYPGADGLGPPLSWPCVPTGTLGVCIRPFHDRQDVTAGGPHNHKAAIADVDGGKMDGFVQEAEQAQGRQCTNNADPQCASSAPMRVMGYYDKREIPNYWAYARHYVLQDHFFESTDSWSFPQHLDMVAGWSARCATHNPMSCTSTSSMFGELSAKGRQNIILAYTDITYLLHAAGVSWRYYVEPGKEPDCELGGMIICRESKQRPHKPGIWNPLPQFDTVNADGQLHDVTGTHHFFVAAREGRLPAVSWVVPNSKDSEHPPARISNGQAWVTRLVNAVMRSPDWKSTAIFLNWDDWGGYYDGMPPVSVDGQGYGLRVPALVISPWAKPGYIDHQVLSTDAYLKFIEDRWLRGQRLNPRTDGRPDSRPDVRENMAPLGNLLADFNFHQHPVRRVLRNPHPPTDLLGLGG